MEASMGVSVTQLYNLLEMRFDYQSARNTFNNWRKLAKIKDEPASLDDAQLKSLLGYLKEYAPDATRVHAAVDRLILARDEAQIETAQPEPVTEIAQPEPEPEFAQPETEIAQPEPATDDSSAQAQSQDDAPAQDAEESVTDEQNAQDSEESHSGKKNKKKGKH